MENEARLRLLRLAELLQTESDAQHPISTAEIVAALQERWGMDAHRITVQKDIAALQAAGLEIETIRSTQNRYYLDACPFELPELKLLLDAVASSKLITQKKSEIFEEKLLKLTSRHAAAELRRNLSVTEHIKPTNEHIYYYIDAINEAIGAGRKISFHYFTYTSAKEKCLKNNGAPYVLSPYALLWSGDYYYLIGWSEKHGKPATFRVDRILDTPRLLDEPAIPCPEQYRLADFAEKSFRLFDAERVEVELHCDECAMNSVIDHFGEDARTVPTGDGGFLLYVEVSLSPPFFAWVFQFGGKLRLLGPPQAVEQYRALLRQGEDAAGPTPESGA